MPTPSPVAVVTGAGSGVGLHTALLLSREGWRVVLAGRRESALSATAARCERPAEHLVVPTDLADPDAPGALIDRALDEMGRVDALVNNAGQASLTPIAGTTAASLAESFAVNAFGPALAIARVFPAMCAQGGGRIVNVASRAVRDPFPGFFAYAAAKSALDSLTRSVENEGARFGVHAFTVAPGAIETPMLRSMFTEDQLPADQTLPPENVAHVIVNCAAGHRDEDAGSMIDILPAPLA